ncbi:uncharacterized protein LOC112094268 [Morus notabilis]|uniref:uncharacterized protein LOC112094268 n=1 Tax=Morus notabilis TaxID=981085 RepID=UPI000CED1B1A|nr:uncharacterized protein LOC112094268 [Morus notabilis]
MLNKIDTRKKKKKNPKKIDYLLKNSTTNLENFPFWALMARDGLYQNSSDDPNSSFDDEDDNSVISKEESELEKEIKRLILTGNSDRLKPNSGQAVTVGDHHAYVGFHEENGSDNRVWEWHGHSLRFDNENGYRPECTYGSCIERLPSNRSGTVDGEEAEEEKEGEKVVANLGLRHLIDGGKADRGISRVLHRNIDAGSSSGTARAIR